MSGSYKDHSEEKSVLVKRLGRKAIDLSQNKLEEIERCCWIVLHEYIHGVPPVEYDIREIDEGLYLEILNYVKLNI